MPAWHRAVGVALSILASAVLTSCVQTGEMVPPSISLANVTIENVTLLRQDLQVELRIGNPNDFDIPLSGLTVRLDVNGEQLAEGFSNARVTVPRLAEASVPVRASTDTLSLLRQILLLGDRQSIHYRLSGIAYVAGPLGTRRVPYDREGTLNLMPPSTPGAPPERRTFIPT